MEIAFYQPDDFDVLRDLTRRSFALNSFNVDSHLPCMLKGEVFFETLARQAMRENTKSCLVARIRGQAMGYIIHGVDTELSGMFGMKTATIMLFCVAEEAQGKGVGRALLFRSINMLRSKGVELITVGTDSNNIAALNLYQDSGFRLRMNWGTYRYYPKFPLPPRQTRHRIVPYGGEREAHDLVKFSERPIAFFREKKIPLRKMVVFRNQIWAKIVSSIERGEYGTLIAKQPGLLRDRVLGLLTYEEETKIQEFFDGAGKSRKVYRVNDIVVHKDLRGRGVATDLLSSFLHSLRDYHFVEAWVSMENWPLLNVLAKCGFRISHLATVLHYVAPSTGPRDQG